MDFCLINNSTVLSFCIQFTLTSSEKRKPRPRQGEFSSDTTECEGGEHRSRSPPRRTKGRNRGKQREKGHVTSKRLYGTTFMPRFVTKRSTRRLYCYIIYIYVQYSLLLLLLLSTPLHQRAASRVQHPKSCGSQQSLPPGGKESLHFVGIRPEVQARKGGW